MKKFIFTALVSIFASYMIANDEANQKEFKREVTKEYSVGANANLRIENKFGEIRIVEGTDNKITFKIEIIGKGTTDALAREYAEAITIDFNQSGDNVSAKTNMKELKCNNCGRTTNYTVVVPKSVTMSFDNQFGNIKLENTAKPLNVKLQFGDLTSGTLADANINIQYGNVTIAACNNLTLNSEFSKMKIGKVTNLTSKSKYDEFTIGTISDFETKTEFSKIKIDKLDKRFVCNNFNYCTLNISEISTQFSEINIKASFTTINLPLDSRHSFKANLKTEFGSIKAGSFTMSGKDDRNKQTYSGTIGSGNPSATVDITTSFADIVFK